MNTVQPIRDKEKLEEMKEELKKKGTRDFLLFYTGINTGLRISDIVKLNYNDIRNQDGTMKQYITIVEKKTNKIKKFPLCNGLFVEMEKYTKNMTQGKYLFKSRKGDNRPLTTTQAYRIIKECGEKVGLTEIGTHTILIMIYSGLRIGELLDLRIKNIHLKDRYMIGGNKTKAGKNRIIPISKKTEPFIKKYYETNKDKEFLIINSFGRQMQYSNYRREKFDNIMEKFRMDHRPHDTRHTFASLMDSAGANKLCIKRIMGHSSPDITDNVYTHKTIQELIEAIDLI